MSNVSVARFVFVFNVHLTLMITSAQVVETSVNVTSNSPSQDYTHPDDRNLPNYDYYCCCCYHDLRTTLTRTIAIYRIMIIIVVVVIMIS